MRFWDTSALFPLLSSEEGSSHAVDLLRSDREITIWWGTPVELASAAGRLRRMGRVDDAECARILAKIGPLARTAEEIQPTEELRQTAFRLVRLHDITAADSLQLAAALVWARHVPTGLDFVCMDTRLCEAAEKEGFTVLG
ncbi:MAG: type II toxin-antitoxin system VapC family toxin [Armatimonadota bacterium]|nr:type II toxin-antitoxin system VapC family toxin [Armatimonadota bacterium]